MKAFLLYDNNGCSYEDYQEWITHVLLVPDDFDADADELAVYQRLCPPDWLKQNGWPKAARCDKARVAYVADLLMRFQSIPFAPDNRPT